MFFHRNKLFTVFAMRGSNLSQALLVKEYGGRTVVFRVPTEAGAASEAAGDGGPTGEGQGGSDAAAIES